MRTTTQRSVWIRMLAVASAGILWQGSPARAQPRIVVAPPNVAGDEAGEAAAATFEFNQGAMVFFDESAVQTQLEGLVTKKIAVLDRRYHLSAGQQQRLRLAGQGDIRRLFERFHVAREKFVAASRRRNEEEIRRGRAAAAVLNFEFTRGPFAEASLFAKAENAVLLPEQLATFERGCRRVAAGSTRKITLDNARRLQTAALFRKDVRQFGWTPRNDEIAILGFFGTLEICARDTLRVRRSLGKGHSLGPFDVRGDWCAVGPGDELTQVYLLNASTGREVVVRADFHHATADLSPDGRSLALGGDGNRTVLWSIEKSARVREIGAELTGGPLTPVFSPDGKIVAVGSGNGRTFLFDVASGRMLHRLQWQASHELKFDPSGKRLAVAYHDGNLAIWDAATGELAQRALGRVQEVHTIDWSPDGKLLASGGLLGSVTVWDAATLKSLIDLDAPDLVHCVRFNPEGTRLYFAGGPAQPSRVCDLEVWAVPAE